MKSARERHNDSAQKSDLEANKDSELRDEVKNAVDECKKKWRNWILARAIFVPFLLTILGFCSFVVSMITYTWKSQPVSAAAIATIASIAGFFSMFCMYLDYEAFGVISEMRFGRLRI
ncbi:hypothetical protein RhiJN_25731 [Ceratobasidium sp. AG-Ba]|nr:hypothetical protein RhiJN_25731 [Ceratobasidium sp. AG-Ba]